MIEPVAICAPAGRDASVLSQILATAKIECTVVDESSLIVGVARSSYALALMTEEALLQLSMTDLKTALSGQPLWSDLHFIVLTPSGTPLPRIAAVLRALGNVSRVDRPVHPEKLVDMVQVSIRARRRQLEARRYLDELEQVEKKLRSLTESLEEQVMERTRALADSNARLSAEIRERIAAQQRMDQMQAELIHVSRVSAMGTMASVLAHELNQPLTAAINYVRGSVRLLRSCSLAVPTDIMDALEAAAGNAYRAGEIIRRVRELVARGEVTRREENLANLIDEALAIAMIDAATFGANCTLALDPEAPNVYVDRIQIQQVLINVVRNAMEAMHSSTRREILVSSKRQDNGMIELAVSDTGPGLSPETLVSLFSPFATTKEKGMGIGLSISRTIVEANSGTLVGENLPSGGAIFRLTLPACQT